MNTPTKLSALIKAHPELLGTQESEDPSLREKRKEEIENTVTELKALTQKQMSPAALSLLRQCSAWNADAENALAGLVRPSLRIGTYRLRTWSDGTVWIENELGEGMATPTGGALAELLDQFWQKNF